MKTGCETKDGWNEERSIPVSYTHLDVYKRQSLRYVREQSTVFDMVAQECGIAAVLDDQVSAIRDNPKITAKRFARPIEFETGLMWNRNKYLSGSARKFIDFIGRYQDK